MSTPVYSNGAGLLYAPEMLVREILVNRIQILLSDRPLQELLLRRLDTLNHGSQAQFHKDALEWLRGLSGRLRIEIIYPNDDAALPALSVVMASGSEDPTYATCGDVWRKKSEMIGTLIAADDTSSTVYDHHERTTGITNEIQIGAWSVRPEESSLLFSVARWALFAGKGDLQKAGIPEMSWSESGFQPTTSPLYPHVQYVPMIAARLPYVYQTRLVTGPHPHRITMQPSTFTVPST